MFHTHNLLGLFVLVVTVWSSLDMYAYHDWTQNTNPHSVLGLILLLLSLFAGLSGIATSSMMQFYNGDKPWASRDKVHNVAKAHRYSSYLVLVVGNGVTSGGIATYFSKIGYGIWGTFGVCTSVFFLATIAIHELCLRRYNRREFKLLEGDQLWAVQERIGQRVYTPAEIEESVAQGEPLCICDNLVLRTDGYERIHPGGKFTIVKNFGRDIAKFYYGNYSLTNDKLSKPHTHTVQANQILQSMIVGVIYDQHDVVEIPSKIFAKHTLTDNIATFTFKTLDGKVVRNYKSWY